MELHKQSLLGTPKRKVKDPCPVCHQELYLNDKRSQRVGIIDRRDRVTGWLCSKCKTEFDLDNRVVMLFSDDEIRGEA